MSLPTPAKRPASYDKSVALVLKGGGALGSCQAGVYEALSDSQYIPDWVAGISIGAINAAIIAGNARENRITSCESFGRESRRHRLIGPQAPAVYSTRSIDALVRCRRYFLVSQGSSTCTTFPRGRRPQVPPALDRAPVKAEPPGAVHRDLAVRDNLLGSGNDECAELFLRRSAVEQEKAYIRLVVAE